MRLPDNYSDRYAEIALSVEQYQLNLPFSNCNTCPLFDANVEDLESHKGWPTQPIYAFIGEAQGAVERQHGTCFAGPAGQMLHQWIDKAPLPLAECFFSNVVLCRPTEGNNGRKNRAPTDEEIAACACNLEATLDRIQPRVVIPLGATALKAISGIKAVGQNLGKIMRVDSKPYEIMPLWHPSYVMQYAPGEATKCISSLRRLKNYVEGVEERRDHIVIKTKKQLDSFLMYISKKDKAIFDFETTGKYIWDKLLGISFCADAGLAFYIPLVYSPEVENLYKQKGLDGYLPIIKKKENMERVTFLPFWGEEQGEVERRMGELLISQIRLGAHNAKFDMKMSKSNLGVMPTKVGLDSMLMHHLIDAEAAHDVNSLVYEFPHLVGYNDEMDKVKSACGKQFKFAPIDIIGKYGAGDADVEYRLVEKFSRELSDKHRWLYTNLVRPMQEVYARAELFGLHFDMEYSLEMERKYTPFVERLEARFADVYGVNPGSQNDVPDFLYKKHKLKVSKKTKAGYSTDKESLKELLSSKDTPNKVKAFCRDLLEYRSNKKQLSTYVIGIREHISPHSRAHPSTNLHGARTGRLSANDPPIQTFPIKEPWYVVRGQLGPDKNHVWIGFDFKTLEVTVLAHQSQDPILIEACRGDVHTFTAANVHGIKRTQVTKAQRKKIKEFVFGGLYGGGEYTLWASINKDIEEKSKKVPLATVRQRLRAMLATYPTSQQWIKRTIAQARKDEYVVNPFGRVRYLPKINSRREGERGHAERQVINTTIQGTASDIVQFAFIECARQIVRRGMYPAIRCLFTIHDELMFQVHKDAVDDALAFIPVIMTCENKAIEILGIDYLQADATIYEERWGFGVEV